MDVYRTIVVTAANQAKAAEISGAFDSGLSPSGELPATHYIASGYIPEAMLAALTKLPDTYISQEEPFEALDTLSLKLIQ